MALTRLTDLSRWQINASGNSLITRIPVIHQNIWLILGQFSLRSLWLFHQSVIMMCYEDITFTVINLWKVLEHQRKQDFIPPILFFSSFVPFLLLLVWSYIKDERGSNLHKEYVEIKTIIKMSATTLMGS